MKKQYRYCDASFGKRNLLIYHDGILVERKTLWLNDFFDEEEILVNNGYTYGFFDIEIEKAKQRYESMLNHRIEVKDE